MTANLGGRKVDCDGLDALIRDVDPDVLALQEVSKRATAVVTERFAHHRLEPYSPTLSSGIACRFPAAFEALSFATRSGWSARLDPGDWPDLDETFELISVHLGNPIRHPMWKSQTARRQQLEVLVAHLAQAVPSCAVVGDFNASPLWPAYRRVAQLLTDAAVATNSSSRTWRLRARGPLLLRIDHIFIRGARACHTTTAEIPGSDHLALFADLEIQPAPT